MESARAIFLVVDSARGQALTRAWERFDDPAVAEVDLYFRAASDVALVGVGLRSGSDRGRWIGRVVASGVAVIDPARMSEGDRRAFYGSYLASYEQVATGCAGIAAAMTALRWRSQTPKAGARGTGPAAAVTEATLAPPPAGEVARGTPPPPLPPTPPVGRGDPTRATALGLGAIREPGHEVEVPAMPSLADVRKALPVARSHERARAPTVNLRAPDALPAPPRPASEADRTNTVAVRFLRGGQWSPARLRALSAKGAYLVTGAPPRLSDEVYVALDLDERSALVRGTVYHVTSARDASATGSSGFAVRFAPEPCAARTRLLELLQDARARGVVIKPPPPRASMRFPVRWAVALRGAHPSHVDALDVSAGGLFVAAPSLPIDATLGVTVPVDVGDPPIDLVAKVTRVVTTGAAEARGLAPGAGLLITEMSEGDRVRWTRFLARVERRTTRTVVVGASLPRLEAITRVLADAGYAVAACSDPGSLLRAAERGSLPDAAVIDDSLLAQGVAAGWLEQMFSAHQVPCITLRGEVSRARLVVDRLLAVGIG
ncbi:MAG: PilZ domain-containing protein [Myxococcales bacterium]|nr:PilZ domain-containing protein [Myxococcales bacterium]